MKSIFLYTVITLIFTIPIQAQDTWTLDECISYAKQNNIEIIKQKLINKISKEDIIIAKGNFYPDASFNATQGFSLGNSFNVSTGVGQLESRFNSFSLLSSVNIYNGFKNKYLSQQAKMYLEKGKIDLDNLNLELSLSITRKYLEVLFNREILLATKEQEIISLNEVKRLRDLFNSSLTPKINLLEMKSTLENDKKEVTTAQNNLDNSLIELQELLGIKFVNDFDIEEVKFNDFEDNVILRDENDAIENALKTSSYIKSFQVNKEIGEKSIQIEKTNLYPELNFYYAYSTSYYHIQGRDDLVFNQETGQFENNGFLIQLDNNRTHNLGFSLIVPIFNKFYTKSNISKQIIRLEIINSELENAKNVLKNKIMIAYNDSMTAKSNLESSKSSESYQSKAFNVAKIKYAENLLSSYEFLESKSKYVQSQSNLISAKYDYLFKLKILEYYNN